MIIAGAFNVAAGLMFGAQRLGYGEDKEILLDDWKFALKKRDEHIHEYRELMKRHREEAEVAAELAKPAPKVMDLGFEIAKDRVKGRNFLEMQEKEPPPPPKQMDLGFEIAKDRVKGRNFQEMQEKEAPPPPKQMDLGFEIAKDRVQGRGG